MLPGSILKKVPHPRAAVAAALLVAAAAIFGFWHKTGVEPHPVNTAATQERLVIATTILPDIKPVAATVTTRDMAEARARINGTLVQLAVREGDEVKQGQLVAQIQDQRLTFETNALDAQVSAAAAEVTRVQSELARVKELYAKGVYAKARLDDAEAAARAADGALKAAKAQRAASVELSAQGSVYAPKAGRVLRANVPAGSVVMAGQSIATITAGDSLLRLEIPEAQARALQVGGTVGIAREDLPGIDGEGAIIQVYPSVTAGRVVADITVPGLRADLVGQRARVYIKLGERDAIVVPNRFIATRNGIDFVRLQGPGGPTEIPVQIANVPMPDEKEVLSGLEVGDAILLPEPLR